MNDRSWPFRWLAPGLASLLVLLAIQPLLLGHTPWPGDGLLHFYRLAQLESAVRQGVLFPRWLPNLGYGYGFPLFNYYSPLSYHISLVPRVAGLSLATSLRISFMFALLLLGLASFLWARSVWKSYIASVTAVLAAVYAPYTLYNTYHRAALAELWGLAFLVLTLWATGRLFSLNRPKGTLIIAILSYAGLILSHNITALVGTPLILGYAMFLIWLRWTSDRPPKGNEDESVSPWIPLFAFVLVALGLSAFFWLPAFFERELVQIENLYQSADFAYANNFLDLKELLAWPNTADPSQVNPPIPRSLSWPAILLAITAWLPGAKLTFGQKAHRLGFSLVTLAFVFMILPVSRWVWDALPLLDFVQFPWRFLGPAGIALGMLAGLGAHQLWTTITKLGQSAGRQPDDTSAIWTKFFRPAPFVLLISAFILIYALPFLFPSSSPPLPETITPTDTIIFEIETGWLGTTAAADYLPRTVRELPAPDSLLAQYKAAKPDGLIGRFDINKLPDEFNIIDSQENFLESNLTYESDQTVPAVFNIFSFPGWRAWIDGRPLELSPTDPDGLISATLPAGNHTLELKFTDTPLRLAAKLISLVSLVILALLVIQKAANGLRSTVLNEPGARPLPVILPAASIVIVIFLVKTAYIDHVDTPFRQSSFDGRQLQGQATPVQVNFGDELKLLGYEIPESPVPADESLDVTLYWQALTPVDNEYSVSLQIVDGEGRRFGQHDSFHPAGLPVTRWQADQYGRDQHRLEIWPGTPPGIYFLKVFVYDRVTGRRLETLNETGLPVGVEYDLGWVEIDHPSQFPDPASVVVDYRLTSQGLSPVLAEGVQLLGFDLTSSEIEVGQPLPVTLFWYTPAVPAVDYESHLSISCGIEESITRIDLPAQLTPNTSWQPEQLLRADTTLWVPPVWGDGTPVEGGACTLFLALIESTSEEQIVVALAPINVTVPDRSFKPPTPENISGVALGDVATLLGYDLDQTELKPGDRLKLTLYWLANDASDRPLTVFVQMLGQDGRIYAQQDQVPLAGGRPTTGWLNGEYITDTYQLTIEPETKSGIYQLIAGMYDNQSGNRLPSSVSGQDFILLPERVEILAGE
jgi:hypothetical protein